MAEASPSSPQENSPLQLTCSDWRLPIDHNYKSTPPKGTWEDGYRWSLEALKIAEKHPEIWETRARRRCDVEFVL